MPLLKSLLFSLLTALLIIPTTRGQQPERSVLNASRTPVQRQRDSVAAMRVPVLHLPEALKGRMLPSTIDNTNTPYWPKIRDQHLFYSCQQYAGAVYVFGYEINRMRNRTGWLDENSFPAHYTWSFMNEAERYIGVDFLQSFNVIRQQGHMTVNDFGGDTASSVLGWPNGYEKYRSAMNNRLRQVYAIETGNAEGVNTLRNYLFDHLEGASTGGIGCFTTSSEALNQMHTIPPGLPEAGKHVVSEWRFDPNHGLTIVGYNDSVRYDVNQDGKFTRNLDITGDGIVDMRDWETGAFKIANSYGNWWADTGYTYAMYRSFAMPYGFGGVWNNRVYVVEADTAYRPLLGMKVTLACNLRDRIRVRAGINTDTLATMPSERLDFPLFCFQGGEFPMQGYDTVPGSDSLEFGLDVTQLLNHLSPGQKARFFLEVEERDPGHACSGRIVRASFISYAEGNREVRVADTGVAFLDNNSTFVSAVAAFSKPDVHIITASLPPLTTGLPLQVQLEAAGGSPPYRWSLPVNYAKVPGGKAEPPIWQNAILPTHSTEYFTAVGLPFSFPFYGKMYDSIYVNNTGFICFERQNLPAPYSTEEGEMLKMFPVISPAFSLSTAYMFPKNDGMWYEGDASHAVVRWKTSVAPYYYESIDDYAVELFPDGHFDFLYGTMENNGFLHTIYTGISKGDQEQSDIGIEWDANQLSGKSLSWYPPLRPDGVSVSPSGMLSVTQAEPGLVYSLRVRAEDAHRIGADKELTLAEGLEVGQSLLCGADSSLKAGTDASLKVTLVNRNAFPVSGLQLKLRCADTTVRIPDSTFAVQTLAAGQTLVIPTAFRFRLVHGVPDCYPVRMTLTGVSAAATFLKELVFPVTAPDLSIEQPVVDDGYNGRMDPGEIADLAVLVRNRGGLGASNLTLKLSGGSSDLTVISDPQVNTGQLGPFSDSRNLFRLRASQTILPGTIVPMRLDLKDTGGLVKSLTFEIVVGRVPVAVVDLAQNHQSARAMRRALDSLNIPCDSIFALPFDYNRYSCIFLVLGTASQGNHVLTMEEGSSLAGWLDRGGRLYMESYYTWYYPDPTALHSRFHYNSAKVSAWFYPDVAGIPSTLGDGMSFVYTSPLSYAVFSFEPVAPAYATFRNLGTPARNLEIAYDGADYKTIGSVTGFGFLDGQGAPSDQKTLMKRYLEFFDLNLTGPFPLFHAASTTVCQGAQATFTDDSFRNIVSRSWEFPGGTPSTATGEQPAVRYDAPGDYDVKLTVSDGVSTQSILKKQYIHVEHCTGVAENGKGAFLLYPNPAGDRVYIGTAEGSRYTVCATLHDPAGRIVSEQTLLAGSGEPAAFNLAGIRPGLYVLRLSVGGKTTSFKVVKE